MKFLLLLAVVAVALWLFKTRARPLPPGGSDAAKRPSSRPAAETAPAPMLACARCGLHLPQSEALLDDAGRAYCSPAHREAGSA